MNRTTIVITSLVTIALPVFATLSACTIAPPETGRAFSHDWAGEQRRVETERRLKERDLYLFGQEVKPPGWLDTREGRAELSLGESSQADTSISVDRGELGLRRRWGGSKHDLPAPPGYDERGNPIRPEAIEE